jgi:hypothetical protein
VGYLICGKCKSYYQLQKGESPKDFVKECECGGKVRYVENLDIVDPSWRLVYIKKKPTKREVLREKTRSLSFIPRDIKTRLDQFFHKHFANLIYTIRNRNRVHRTPHGTPYSMGTDFIKSLMNELNFRNIRWILVIPFAIAITLILAFTQGIFYLLTFILLVAVGYLFEDIVIGTKNAAVTGTISFFLGSLFTGSFLFIIPFIILGVINGAVCGWIGGYIRTKIYDKM